MKEWLKYVLPYLYTPFQKESDQLCLVNRLFFETYRDQPCERIRTQLRNFALHTDPPAELPDRSQGTLREYHNRVVLICLSSLLAEERLLNQRWIPDNTYWPAANPEIPFEFSPLSESDKKQISTFIRNNVKIQIQSSPFESEWLAFDAFSDERTHSTHHRWCEIEISLKEGVLTLYYEDTFDHDDAFFGRFGQASRVLKASVNTEKLAKHFHLKVKEPHPVYQGIKQYKVYNHLRYYFNEDFFLKFAECIGMEECSISTICTVVSILVTQTERRIFSALLPYSSTLQPSKDIITDLTGDSNQKLKALYPSKVAENQNALKLRKCVRDVLLQVDGDDKIKAITTLRNILQTRYDAFLLEAVSPAACFPLPPPPPPPPPAPTQFNPAINNYYLQNYFYDPYYHFMQPPWSVFPNAAPYPGYPQPMAPQQSKGRGGRVSGQWIGPPDKKDRNSPPAAPSQPSGRGSNSNRRGRGGGVETSTTSSKQTSNDTKEKKDEPANESSTTKKGSSTWKKVNKH